MLAATPLTGAATPTVHSVKHGNTAILEAIWAQGVILSTVKTHHGQNLAHVAAKHGVTDNQLWNILGDQEIDILAEDRNGQTPADLARDEGHAEKFTQDMALHGLVASPGREGGGAYEDDFE